MTETRRLLTLAAAISLTLCAGVASAQTVLVRNAPPDSTIEVMLNSTAVGSTKVGASGIATVAGKLSEDSARTEIDAQIFVDVCGDVRRVVIVERAVLPASADVGCIRRDMGGLFLVKRISTLVIDFANPTPTLLLRQGSVSLDPPRVWAEAPTGLVLFGGGAFTTGSVARSISCGNVAPCDGKSSGFSFTAGATFWIRPFLGAEGAYIKPAEVTSGGSGEGFRFTGSFKSEIITASGKIGIPLGPVRLFGKVGGAYHRATTNTTQIVEARTVTVDGVEQTIQGGTANFNLRTAGWAWIFGGGGEVWFSPTFAVYGELGRASLKGPSRESETAEGVIDDRMTTVLFGIRLRVGG
ncbi:MAG TPA: hypothetical protein VH740_10180 [Vicinamibacterales bacterium]